ncbi:hypothetical protein VD0002_g3311 [Verticillium dahliae]|uniref:Uncharacterized protein n=2 Tax=Verticillium dahliae TaxID=27337 RepID=G2XF48_VERDV|nr:uncharacterized protein VDAG_08780 [Verticillium dahliae VdLs.17]KAH6688133.1 hypothetical protein EV126DRAFT_512265 [Verticillium dahliae]EGY18446.1 hypothetical protein VDAG_08780 [Verticillium dahliae VdLs.17]PNH34704.1 hypothetical protein BJF96_g2272 [Verticillium dahliae]PNH52858.1 hypothetical protein VD0003_g4495 [Verticillium dahliae]PNH65833.1 hypothetical protein VD0002_g3311 [Verticillium dahliae]
MTLLSADEPGYSAPRVDGNDQKQHEPHRTLAIALSTVLSVLAVVLIGGTILACYRYRQGRLPLINRGITPIDDEEIESWKYRKEDEDTIEKVPTSLTKHASTASLKKPPSVVIYQNHNQYQPRASGESQSPHSFTFTNGGKKSIEIPQTPVLARAPNSRPGLTDEAVQGAEAFIPSPKRQTSRLSKYPPSSSATSPRGHHGRTQSSRSSFSFGGSSVRDQWYGYGHSFYSDGEFSPRSSNEQLGGFTQHGFHGSSASFSEQRNHHRVFSTSSVPPSICLDDEVPLGGLSPRPVVPQSAIGRAIG